MAPSTSKLKIKVDSGEKLETRFRSFIKKRWYFVHKKSSSLVILPVLWQSEWLPWSSVVLPLHVLVFGVDVLAERTEWLRLREYFLPWGWLLPL
jgi:hypothetical protein